MNLDRQIFGPVWACKSMAIMAGQDFVLLETFCCGIPRNVKFSSVTFCLLNYKDTDTEQKTVLVRKSSQNPKLGPRREERNQRVWRQIFE